MISTTTACSEVYARRLRNMPWVMRGPAEEEIVAPIEERVQALLEAIEATEAHLRGLGFDPATLPWFYRLRSH